MAEPSLAALEDERVRLYAQLSMIGDFWRGSVSENRRKCGKPNCACVAPGHPGHGARRVQHRVQRGRGHLHVRAILVPHLPVLLLLRLHRRHLPGRVLADTRPLTTSRTQAPARSSQNWIAA